MLSKDGGAEHKAIGPIRPVEFRYIGPNIGLITKAQVVAQQDLFVWS